MLGLQGVVDQDDHRQNEIDPESQRIGEGIPVIRTTETAVKANAGSRAVSLLQSTITCWTISRISILCTSGPMTTRRSLPKD